MKRRYQILSVLAAASVCLCACTADRTEAVSGAESASVPESTAVSRQMPQDEPVSQNVQPEKSESEPETERVPVNMLTGLPLPEGTAIETRPLAVMIDNVQAALPQRGLQAADQIYEMVTEGGITRLMAVYSDYTAMPAVGPVRSARDQHVQMMFPLQSLYLHVGGSTYAKDMLAKYKYEDTSINSYYRSGALELDVERNSRSDLEHCWFTNGELFTNAAHQYGLDTQLHDQQPVFCFADPQQEKRVPSHAGGNQIYLRFSGYANSEFTYNAETAQYAKAQFGEPHLDENTGEAITFDNLLILFAQQEKYPGGVLTKIHLEQQGVGWYFSNGGYEPVRWAKGAPEDPLRILAADGSETPVQLNPGRMYIAVADLELYPHFRVDGAVPEWNAAG